MGGLRFTHETALAAAMSAGLVPDDALGKPVRFARLKRPAKSARAPEQVVVVAGSIEASNVNPVSGLVNMISQSRAFEMQMKMLQTADTNEQSANQLLNFS